ncbi:MAG: hypothetical protein HYU39_06000 [Thaumarchaeota archaeon]|nr:hypothetical protein [Nitrososphaerota archaeon]
MDVGPRRRLVYDEVRGRLVFEGMFGRHDVIAMPKNGFLSIIHELHTVFSSGAALILVKAGKGVGENMGSMLAKADDPVSVLKNVLGSPSRWGLGRHDLVDFDAESLVIRFRILGCPLVEQVCPECQPSFYVKGLYQGFLSAALRRNMDCEVTVSDSPRGGKNCEVRAKPVEQH